MKSLSRMSLAFAWYDLWVGAFYDRKARVLYVCPFPTLLLTYRRPAGPSVHGTTPDWRAGRAGHPDDCPDEGCAACLADLAEANRGPKRTAGTDGPPETRHPE